MELDLTARIERERGLALRTIPPDQWAPAIITSLQEDVRTMPPVELDAAFELLKILARQPQLHGKHLYRQEVIRLCLVHRSHSLEALKLLVNIVHQSADARCWFHVEENGAGVICTELQREAKPLSSSTSSTTSSSVEPIEGRRTMTVFLYLRLAFLMLAMRGEFSHDLLAVRHERSGDVEPGGEGPGDDGFITTLNRILTLWTEHFVSCSPLRLPSGTGLEPSDAIQEAYKVAFTLMLQDGKYVPTSSTTTNTDAIDALLPSVPSAHKFKSLLAPARQLFDPLSTECTKLMNDDINVPADKLPLHLRKLVEPWSAAVIFLFHMECDEEFREAFVPLRGATHDLSFVDTISLLFAQIVRESDAKLTKNVDSQESDDTEELRDNTSDTSLLFVLLRLTVGCESARHRMKRLLLPDGTDRTRPLNEGHHLHNVLVRQLTNTASPQFKEALGELLWQLCDSDAHRFVHYVSYGSGAGVLMKKGHLKMPAPTAMSVDDQGRPLNDSTSSAGIQGTNTTATITPQINPMTGAFFTAAELDEEHTAGADMTEEEKAEENSRLIDAFERLNRTGIVSVGVPPDLLAERERMRREQLDRSGAGDAPSKK